MRNLLPGETLPFAHGCEPFPALDLDWSWVAVDRGQVCGVLIGAPLHGVFFILRIVVPPDSPSTTALVLLRQVRRAVRDRGIRAWMTFLSPELSAENHMLRIAQRVGASFFPMSGAWVVGRV